MAPSVLGDQWYDRPYYLGPDADDGDYFALAEALHRKNVVGIARWVMRKKRYVGALTSTNGYLMLSTLASRGPGAELLRHRARQGERSRGQRAEAGAAVRVLHRERFRSSEWQNEYRKRLCKLIEAKARGEKIEPVKRKRKAASASLADSLRASIAAVKEKKVA